MERLELKCKKCGRKPEEIQEYRTIAKENGYDDAYQACLLEEGTLNRRTGEFYCTKCYIDLGMPTGTA